jgi:hypothetical protein
MAGEAPALTPTPPAAGRWWVDALWLFTLGAWAAGWCLSAAPKLGITYDEVFYLDAGLLSWRGWHPDPGKARGWAHEYAATHGVMPLPPDVVTIPLYIHERRTGEKFEGEAKFTHLGRARAMTLGWLWLLVLSAWRLGRHAAGPWAGRIASGLVAADPNFLAHATLATTDIAVSATLLAFTRAVYAGRDGGWWKRVTLPGIWFGIAVLCKLSALLYGGFILVVLEICHRFSTGALSRPPDASLGAWAKKAALATLRSVLAAAGVIVIGVAIAFAYCGIPDEGERPFTKVAKSVPPEEPLKPRYEKWAEGSGRVPHAASAFAFQWWWNNRGRPTFLNGTYYPEGYRWYFPELLLMKLPVPIFLLALVVLPRPRALLNPFALTALVLLAVLLKANVQIGVRLALPVVAIGYVALATALVRGYPRSAPRIGVPVVVALAVISAWVWPHALGYLNQPSGGTEAAPRRVTDSNLDWGQGVPDLVEWHAANGKPPTVVWYFGTDTRYFKRTGDDHERPLQRFPLHALPIKTSDDLRKAIGPQVLAVGYTVLTLEPDEPPAKVVALEYLKTRRPLAGTATFVLYDFRDEQNGPPPLDRPD